MGMTASRRPAKARTKSTQLPAPHAPAAPGTREILFSAIVQEECDALGIKSPLVVQDLVMQSARLQVRTSETNGGRLRARAISAIEELKPENAAQAMLAVQMVGVHNAVVDFLSRSTAPDQPIDVIDRNVSRATRLMRVFTEQLEAMSKLKGTAGQQKIIVERVDVHEGGRALVGSIAVALPEGRRGDA